MWGQNETREQSMTVRRLKHPWHTSLLNTTGTFQTNRRFAMFIINVRITGKGFLVIAESIYEQRSTKERHKDYYYGNNTGNAEHHTSLYLINSLKLWLITDNTFQTLKIERMWLKSTWNGICKAFTPVMKHISQPNAVVSGCSEVWGWL